MKYFFYICTAIVVLSNYSCNKKAIIIDPNTADSFTVSVINGYGSGKYKTGDTVHIFCKEYTSNQLFDSWTGDNTLLESKKEWHTSFIMHNKNSTITANIKNITAFSLQLAQIKGRDRLKPVYYYFPAGYKGMVYLLHGTSGSASSVAGNYEFQQLYKTLINDGFGIIITEAEEATTGVDANADGKLRWLTNPLDTINNIDYVNIKIITDSLYNRGVVTRGTPRYSIGMSNGGAFSQSLSAIYRFKAGVSYCAPGTTIVSSYSVTPFQFCMAKFDNNDNVGPQGNADAQTNSSTLTGRGICSKIWVRNHCPLYPERFARSGSISVSKSQAIFNELKSKGYLDLKNYIKVNSSVLVTYYLANPSQFPELNSLTGSQQKFVSEQIDLSFADHQMYSDFNIKTLNFLNSQCL